MKEYTKLYIEALKNLLLFRKDKTVYYRIYEILYGVLAWISLIIIIYGLISLY